MECCILEGLYQEFVAMKQTGGIVWSANRANARKCSREAGTRVLRDCWKGWFCHTASDFGARSCAGVGARYTSFNCSGK